MATLGVIGGGQLCRMIGEEIRRKRLPHRLVALDPTPDCPAAPFLDAQIVGHFKDPAKILELAAASDVVTFEIELAGSATLEQIEKHLPFALGQPGLDTRFPLDPDGLQAGDEIAAGLGQLAAAQATTGARLSGVHEAARDEARQHAADQRLVHRGQGHEIARRQRAIEPKRAEDAHLRQGDAELRPVEAHGALGERARQSVHSVIDRRLEMLIDLYAHELGSARS